MSRHSVWEGSFFPLQQSRKLGKSEFSWFFFFQKTPTIGLVVEVSAETFNSELEVQSSVLFHKSNLTSNFGDKVWSLVSVEKTKLQTQKTKFEV